MGKTKEIIGEYEVISPLGAGTVGTVYKVKHQKTEQLYALKILTSAITETPEIKARFLREIIVLEKLSHPNIVSYYGSGVHEGRHFYIMEIVDGGNLKEVLQNHGRLPWQDAIEVGWQICSALQHAHNLGIIHRDLKPANLFLSQTGKIKLGDFGLALDLGEAELTATGLTVGTYLYMAPEQIRGERTISNQTDLYAFGCLLFRILAGRVPFEGTNFAQIFDLHLHNSPPSVRVFTPDCPEELEKIIYHLLKKKQHERPLNARAVQGMLAEVLMKWDEDRAQQSISNKSKTWAVDLNRPILASFITKKPESSEPKVSWITLLILLFFVVGFIVTMKLIGF
jgi:serine/threonine protein kinase